MKIPILYAALILLFCVAARAAEPISLSGIYPHLPMFNNQGECGTGAVVPAMTPVSPDVATPHPSRPH